MKTCVIGGNGFLGRHFVIELQKSKSDIIVVSRSKVDIPNIQSLQVQSLFDKKLEELICNEVEEVVCLAYATKPKTSFENPIKDIEENLAQTVHLFELIAKASKIKKIVYVSSGGAIYGNTDADFINENHVTKPISPYGITKMAIEHYAHLYHTLYQLPAVIVRPSNAYGPGQLAKEGQGFIAYAIQSILQRKPIEIFGSAGTVRDYIYVKDVATAMLACLENGIIGETYNIGSQHGYSNLEIVEILKLIASPFNYEVSVIHGAERPFDVKKNVLSIEKITAHTGWKPEASIQQGLKQTWNDYLNNLKLH